MPPQKRTTKKVWVLILIVILMVLPFGVMLLWQEESPELRWEWDKIDTNDIRFPQEFLWGVATAAHQVEGNSDNNNWSAWENARDENGRPRIKNNQKAGLACDHWNRYREDIVLMQQLGVKAYRFSVEWSKIEPREGEFDEAALQHYREVCDALLAAGLTPMVTLHHFTHPLWFEQKGAFEKAVNIALWIRFCEKVFQALHEKVNFWCTINEPEVFASQGYFQGIFPPGKKDPQLTGVVLQNLLEAHTQVYLALKRLPGGEKAQIGLVKNIFQFDPNRRWNFLDWLISRKLNDLFTDSILEYFKTGHFNFSLPGLAKLEHFNAEAPRTLDFIGLNYYSHFRAQFQFNRQEPFAFKFLPEEIMTDMPYPIYAEGFYRALKTLAQLQKPIYVTENGIADAKDDRRELFIRRYLYAMSRARQEGCDVRGYFYWSLMDNFEWSEGYDMKFGLYEVDFQTQERRLREGANVYAKIIKRE